MTPSEILRKHEDANEMHFHEVDRKFIIEAMEEYAEQQVKATVKYYNGEPVEEYAAVKSGKPINLSSKQTAVEWLVSHWEKLQSEGEKMNWNQIIQITELAKSMEKEQSFEFWQGGINCTEEGGKSFEQYYNETYEK